MASSAVIEAVAEIAATRLARRRVARGQEISEVGEIANQSGLLPTGLAVGEDAVGEEDVVRRRVHIGDDLINAAPRLAHLRGRKALVTRIPVQGSPMLMVEPVTAHTRMRRHMHAQVHAHAYACARVRIRRRMNVHR